ncbi:ubiquinol oxidase subunit II [Roseibium aggregatum]|uniref:Ubiquinol oxidase polypeptide II n=1 Tax=Roseibium aggregatum TaxID=187304 RepID=A0A939J6S0_9HYPH|nr:ubiquinol oxidase subunit II [Roseibium aggregatum]MBN9674037.1 ubiquinol oxidase subunit II [Roseibium aggregatum]
MRLSKFVPLLAASPFLGGCNLVVMNPAGDIASQQAQLIVYSTILMLIVIVPVMALTVIFAIKYRASNEEAEYQPDWHHSTSLEIVIWSVPMAIILCLAGLTWVATHRLNPYSPLQRISAEKEIEEDHTPLVVQVVAMDWKWLFIYPEQGVASVNELAAPVDRPLKFEITSSTVMNSFFVPALAGQIYAMAGMQTELNAVMNEEGVYDGFSANYSGAGFSHMRFKFHSVDEDGFQNWIATVREGDRPLDRAAFLELDEASIADPVSYYSSVDPELWNAVINLCVDSNDLCQNDMMMVDALGGGGLEGLYLREVFAGICSSSNPTGMLSRIRDSREIAQAGDFPGELSLAGADLASLLRRPAGSGATVPGSGAGSKTDE